MYIYQQYQWQHTYMCRVTYVHVGILYFLIKKEKINVRRIMKNNLDWKKSLDLHCFYFVMVSTYNIFFSYSLSFLLLLLPLLFRWRVYLPSCEKWNLKYNTYSTLWQWIIQFPQQVVKHFENNPRKELSSFIIKGFEVSLKFS